MLSVDLNSFKKKYKNCNQNIKSLYKLDLNAPSYCNIYYFGLNEKDVIIRAFSNQAEKEIEFSQFDMDVYKIHPKLAVEIVYKFQPIESGLILFVIADLSLFSLSVKDKKIYESIFKPVEDICDILS